MWDEVGGEEYGENDEKAAFLPDTVDSVDWRCRLLIQSLNIHNTWR